MTIALASLRPLRHRNFALIWAAALVSNIGSWMQTVAMGILVTARTGKPLWTGIVAAAAFVPMGLMAPVGGALADRFDRRRWLIVTTLGETAFAALLAVLAGTHHASPGAVTAVAFLGGMCSAVGFPAYQAMLPDLVDREDLLAAVSLSSAQFNMGRVVGPALAGIVLVIGSYTMAFAVNAASFGAVLIALALVRLPAKAPASKIGAGSDAGCPEHGAHGFLGRIAEGARIAAATPGTRSAILLISIVALLGSPFIALVPAMAIKVLHSKAGGTSVLVTAQGLGAVAGALSMAPMARSIGRYRIVVASLVVFPVTLVLYGLAPYLWVSAVSLFAVGAAYIGVLSGLNTVVQITAPTVARGRVLSLYMFALGTIYPLGALLQGGIATVVGVRYSTIGGALLLFVAIQFIATVKGRIIGALAAVDEPAPGTAESAVDEPAPGTAESAVDEPTDIDEPGPTARPASVNEPSAAVE